MTQSLDFSKIPPLSEDQIDQNSYKLADLWMIHYKKKIHGPYHIDLMHKIAIKFTAELEMSSACNLARGKWYYLFDNKEFQNRNDQTFFRPVVINNEPLLIYAQEKEIGPFELPQVLQMLKKKELKHSDLFSLDSGSSWKKIYEIDGLDRRQRDVSEIKLPDIPDMSAYSQEQKKFLDKAPNNHNVVLELKKIDPISKKRSTQNSQSQPRRARPASSAKTRSSRSTSSSSSKLWLIILIIIGAIAWMMKEEISQLLFQKTAQTNNQIKRKVSKYQLKAKKRAKPRIRLNSPERSEKRARNVQQKEYDSSYEDTLQVDNQIDDADNSLASNADSSQAPKGTALRSRHLNRFVSEEDEAALREENSLGLSNESTQDLFLQTDADESLEDIDQEYLIPASEFSGLDSENFVPLDRDEDEYYDNEEIYE